MNSSAPRSAVPRVLERRAPLTESSSETWAWRSARRRWRLAVIARRARATLRVVQIAGGRTSREKSERRQLRATIATAVATVVVRFEAIETAVLVTTDCIPAMSWVIRDWTSPDRVRVKKLIACRCRWVKTSVRSRCMTAWPTRVEIHVCCTPMSAVAMVTRSMPPTVSRRRRTSWWGIASSMTTRRRKGEAIETSELATMSATTAATCQRWGRK